MKHDLWYSVQCVSASNRPQQTGRTSESIRIDSILNLLSYSMEVEFKSKLSSVNYIQMLFGVHIQVSVKSDDVVKYSDKQFSPKEGVVYHNFLNFVQSDLLRD